MPFPRPNPKAAEDPELVAERAVNGENGQYASTRNGNTINGENGSAAEANGVSTNTKEASANQAKYAFKEVKAERKKRSRGVSGSSIKKDGGRFDMGMENYDAYDDVSDHEEDGYDELAKYAVNKAHGSVYDSNSCSSGSLGTPVHGEESIKELAEAFSICIKQGGNTMDEVFYVLGGESVQLYRTQFVLEALEYLYETPNKVLISDCSSEEKLAQVLCLLIKENVISKDDIVDVVGRDFTNCQHSNMLILASKLADGDSFSESAPLEEIALLAEELGKRETADVSADLARLEMPCYYSHFVHKACLNACRMMNANFAYHVAGALSDLVDHATITLASVRIGFARFFETLKDDLEGEIPAASSIANLLVSYAAHNYELLNDDLIHKCPKPKFFIIQSAGTSGELTATKDSEGVDEENYLIVSSN